MPRISKHPGPTKTEIQAGYQREREELRQTIETAHDLVPVLHLLGSAAFRDGSGAGAEQEDAVNEHTQEIHSKVDPTPGPIKLTGGEEENYRHQDEGDRDGSKTYEDAYRNAQGILDRLGVRCGFHGLLGFLLSMPPNGLRFSGRPIVLQPAFYSKRISDIKQIFAAPCPVIV
jgi:hypothetical protein